jgi:prephenate dehydratase
MDHHDHTVAIQGIPGSFHDEAAHKFFRPDYRPVACDTFRDLFKAMKHGQANFAVMAIENTVAGTILPNYELLRDSNASVVGEVYLAIRQNLLALQGQELKDLREVHSHPMAIQQCHAYFEKHPHIRLVETVDTAASAKWIAVEGLKGVGAIAGKRAADQYGLSVVAAGIETDKRNFTRFLVVTPHKELNGVPGPPDKASLAFHVPHARGSLAKVLAILADYGCNLTKIQSLPIIGREWEYYMHIDLEFDLHEHFLYAMEAILPHVHELKILGEYARGAKPV